MKNEHGNESSSSDSSDSSDDEYLTGKHKAPGGEEEREAIIRKKLLESFYGKSSAADKESSVKKTADSSEFEHDVDDDEDEHVDETLSTGRRHLYPQQRRPFSMGSTNLDSSHFDPRQYAQSLIWNSSTEALLVETDKLATDIRGLDSTMQTLVYENYSKFIDATDAIRSIGRSVGASEAGLRLLAESMDRIERGTSSVDTALKASREAVAEKLRVKRHLSRLDALLKLPNTLRTQIGAGKYRLAAKSHASASHILSQHSSGFESLSRIEVECNQIMTDMATDLERKLEAWTTTTSNYLSRTGNYSNNISLPTTEHAANQPKSVSEIFECAGTLLFLPSSTLPTTETEVIHESKMEIFRKLALDACSALLTQMLETHQKEQAAQRKARERLGSDDSTTLGSSNSSKLLLSSAFSIVPQDFFDTMLEAATLFGMTFTDPSCSNAEEETNQIMLSEFISQLFLKFLEYAKETLEEAIEACMHRDIISIIGQQKEAGLPTLFEKKSSRIEFERIVSDLTRLMKAVRELASGLALPEVGLQVEVCGNLVDRTTELCDALIQRYITAHFQELRAKVISNCLVPFSKHVLSVATTTTTTPEAAAAHHLPALAQALIGDIMQTTDTAISDIAAHLFSAPIEHAILQAVVQKKSFEFAFWLASSLEVFAGCDDTASNDIVLDATRLMMDDENPDDIVEPSEENYKSVVEGQLSGTDWSKLRELVLYLETSACSETTDGVVNVESTNRFFLTLAVAEACRIAQSRVFECINQSIIAVMSCSNVNRKSEKESTRVAARFQKASRCALSLYSSNLGAQAALTVSEEYQMPWVNSNGISYAPNSYACRILQISKLACRDCANVLGFDPLASEARSFPEKSVSNLIYNRKSGFVGNARGLQLDVERMFTEKAAIYSEVECSRDSIAAAIFRISLRAMIECSRLIVFSKYGYRSVQIDVELLRHMIPHYVGSEDAEKLFNLLDDVLFNASERCLDQEPLDEEILLTHLMKWWSDNPAERAKFTLSNNDVNNVAE